MIKKDFRYIIKRIIIGVGIVLVLGFLNGCKVKAYDFSTDTPLLSVSFGSNKAYLYYNKEDNEMLFHRKKSGNYQNLTVSLDNYPYVYCTENVNIRCAFSTGELHPIKNSSGTYVPANVSMYFVEFRASYNEPFYNVNRATGPTTTGNSYLTNYIDSGFNYITNYDIFYKDSNEIYLNKNFNTLSQPEFSSFNAIPITNNNVITSYTIQPEFSSFNTDNYVYQYSFDRNRWLSLTENKQLLRINNNITIYVRIKDKNTNEYIDGSTFTITNIGTFYNNQTYNINFSGDYRTENYLSDNMCVFEGSKSEIKEYQIYIDYVPKSSILIYQYQYVLTDSQLDNNNWQNVPTSDNGSITYVASENGTLYARILDKEDSVLKTATFQVSSIGKIAIDDIDKQCTKNIFQKFSSEINYGGPVSVIFKIPVDVLSSLYNTASTSNTCHPYVISKLMGTDFVLPCINFENKFGSTIYREIDAMLCFILSIMFFKFLLKIYNDFISMKDIN